MMVNIEIYWRHMWGQNIYIYILYILHYITSFIILVDQVFIIHPLGILHILHEIKPEYVHVRCKGVEKLWNTGLPVDSQSCLGVLRNCWNDQTWSNHIKPSTPPRGRSWTCNSKITLSNRKTAFQTFSLFHVAFTGRIFRYLVSCDP